MDDDDIDPCLCYTWSLRDGKCIGLCELPSYSLTTSLNMPRDERGAAPPSFVHPSRGAPALPRNTAPVPMNQQWFYEPVGPSTTIANNSSSVVTSTHVTMPRRGKVRLIREKPIPK